MECRNRSKRVTFICQTYHFPISAFYSFLCSTKSFERPMGNSVCHAPRRPEASTTVSCHCSCHGCSFSWNSLSNPVMMELLCDTCPSQSADLIPPTRSNCWLLPNLRIESNEWKRSAEAHESYWCLRVFQGQRQIKILTWKSLPPPPFPKEHKIILTVITAPI